MMEPRRVTVENSVLLADVCRHLSEGREVCLKTKGNSMLPFIIGDRDSVVLRRCPHVDAGDIVLAQVSPGNYVVHRVISASPEGITLMGDGNIRGTERCLPQDVCGTVICIIEPDGKKRSCRSAGHLRTARIWRALLPARRLLLAVYKRTILRLKLK